MTRKGATLTLIVLAILAAIYAVTLQLTGQPVQAERFVEWAGGGLITLLVLAWIFL